MQKENNIQKDRFEDSEILMNPGEALVAMYNAAINRLELAGDQIDLNRDAANESIFRAQQIILELANALDYKCDEDLCTNLEMIYLFMLDRLAEANRDGDAKHIDTVLKHLRGLRDTWRQAVDAQHASRIND